MGTKIITSEFIKQKLVYGAGVYEKGKYLASFNKKHTKEYQLWVGMLERCYSGNYHKKKPTYVGCTVSENFKNFQFFAEWCNNQVGFGVDGYELDKDILIKGNKFYSEDTCCFVPRKLNLILQTNPKTRGEYPLGVTYFKRDECYRASLKKYGKSFFIGYYQTPDEAHIAYKIAKNLYVQEVLDLYKNEIDRRVYDSLCTVTLDKLKEVRCGGSKYEF